MADIHKPLSIAVQVLVALGMVSTIAAGSWFFVVGPDREPVDETPQERVAQAPMVSIERLAGMHLFGKPGADAEPTENLQETRLSLVLAGVFVADEDAASKAVISQKGGRARLFKVGDRLPGNVHLHKVYRDRVVLSRGGVHELLRFEEGPKLIRRVENPRRTSIVPRNPRRRGTANSPNSANSLKEAVLQRRDEIERDPGKVVEELGLRTSSDGGYVLGAFADTDSFLQPTDRLISVNGRTVGNPREDKGQLEDILKGHSVDVELQRGQQRIKFTLSLEDMP